MRTWLGIGLLAGSWLFGLGLFHPPHWPAWALAVAIGTWLALKIPVPELRRSERLGAALLTLPATAFFPWPYRGGPLAFVVGVLLPLARIDRRWPAVVGRGLTAAGLILTVQGGLLVGYMAWTARSHELPGPLVGLVAALLRCWGVEAAAAGSEAVLRSLRAVHHLAVTREMVFDPASLAFLAGGLTFVGFQAWGAAGQPGWKLWARKAAALLVLGGVWLPIRAALLGAVMLQRIERLDPAQRLNVIDPLLSPWVSLALLAPAVIGAWRILGGEALGLARTETPPGDAPGPGLAKPAGRWRPAAAALLVMAGATVAAFFWQWSPVGRPMPGRVTVVERHSTWEPTDRPYDTESYGEEASYTYWAIYQYCGQFFQMSRLGRDEPLDAQRLASTDVLVIKTITERYAPEEIQAVRQFVEAGGSLLLIAEHTDRRIQTPYANDLASQFGFKFRQDLLFRVGNAYEQEVRPPRVPHPMLAPVPPLVLAVSCSIDPGTSAGEAVMRDTTLWSLPPDYHADNFFPEAELRPEARYGAFIQLWAVRFGRGRVVAWTDSTIFSNFCTFEPGKAELMLTMLQWLNHRSVLDRPGALATVRWLAAALAASALAGAGTLVWRNGLPAVILAAAAVGGIATGSWAVASLHQRAMPLPEPQRPLPRVMIDRTLSEVALATDGFTDRGGGWGFGLLEQWIPRLGYITTRAHGAEAFAGDALVIINPTRSVPETFRQSLADYVAQGGKLLVIDSLGSPGTTANGVLAPFGISVRHATSRQGVLRLAEGWPDLPVEGACEIVGGQPFAWVEDLPVAARTRFGQGEVMAVGFGLEWNDRSFGSHWMRQPTAEEKKRFDLFFATLQALVRGQAVRPWAPETQQRHTLRYGHPTGGRRPRLLPPAGLRMAVPIGCTGG